jgi:hypothetical protein
MIVAYFALFGLPAIILIAALVVYWHSGRVFGGGEGRR